MIEPPEPRGPAVGAAAAANPVEFHEVALDVGLDDRSRNSSLRECSERLPQSPFGLREDDIAVLRIVDVRALQPDRERDDTMRDVGGYDVTRDEGHVCLAQLLDHAFAVCVEHGVRTVYEIGRAHV